MIPGREIQEPESAGQTAERPAAATRGGAGNPDEPVRDRRETSEEKLMSGKQTDGGEGRTLGRRTFLRYGALGGVAAAVAGAAPPEPAEPAPAPAETAPFELEEATIATLQERMQSGALTARDLTEAYVVRIEALDRQGPALRAVLETNPDALAIADALDAERKAKGARGPLHGIPVLLKDNIGTGDRMMTTAGSLALAGSFSAEDSFLAKRLREAGAVLLGKANLSEWANFRSSHSSSGWSGRGGQCRNPYALDRNPCGSSSGSGAAVSANLCAVSVGSETDGSIVCPSSANGIVGIKPTLGLVSRTGMIPLAHSQDTAGPMCRTVADAAALLGVLAGVDPRDPATERGRGHAAPDYTKFLDPEGLRGARVGVARKMFGFSEAVDRLLEEALAEMKRGGAVLVDPADIPSSSQLEEAELEVLLYEFKADLNAYLAGLGPRVAVRTLADLIAFNEGHRSEELPYFGQDLLVKAQAKGPLTTPAYLKALEKSKRLAGKDGLDATLRRYRLDAIVAPTGGPAWVIDLVNGDHFSGGSSTHPAVAGYPNISVPAGFIRGLPVGISFMGQAWSEPTLLKLASSFEHATRHRRPPRFRPNAEV
jgi:amidase